MKWNRINESTDSEYVSESGKICKPAKGKALKFLEHDDPAGFAKDPQIQKLCKKVLSKIKKMRKIMEEHNVSQTSEKYRTPNGNKVEITLTAIVDYKVYTNGGTSLHFDVEGKDSSWELSISADEHIRYPYLSGKKEPLIAAFNLFLNQFSKDFDYEIQALERDRDRDRDGCRIVRENTKSNTQRFNESYDSADFKEKFLDVTMNELGFSEDEIEGLIEQWNQDYDSMSDIIIKFLDGKPLERLEQIQAAYYIGEKLATSEDW